MDILFSTCTASSESGLSARQLYYWEIIGLIKPRYETFGIRRFRRYTRQDLDLLKRAKSLLDQGFTLKAIKKYLLDKTDGHGTPETEMASAVSKTSGGGL